MSPRTVVPPPADTRIGNYVCNNVITMPAMAVNEHTARAIEAVTAAAKANAAAIERCAQALIGGPNNAVGIKLGGTDS
jgi:hypothetical protein